MKKEFQVSRLLVAELASPSPHPDPLPSHRMGAEREQQGKAGHNLRIEPQMSDFSDRDTKRPVMRLSTVVEDEKEDEQENDLKVA